MVKGPGPIDKRFADGGTPTTYPSDGTSFLLPLAAPYDKATVVTCGATWAYFKPGGENFPDLHTQSIYSPHITFEGASLLSCISSHIVFA